MDYRAIEQNAIKWLNRARNEPDRIILELEIMLNSLKGNIYRNPKTGERFEVKEVIEDKAGKRSSGRGH